MKIGFLISVVLLVCGLSASALGACTEDTLDLGICDTVYVQPWPADFDSIIWAGAAPYFVRVPIYVTHDVSDPATDSIAGFNFPFCYTSNNPAKYCSVSGYWNTTVVSTSFRSIFRHLMVGTDTTINWMLRQKELGEELGENWAWSNVILNLTGPPPHFWLSLIPVTEPLFGAESRALIATMTFKVQDTMHVCIDSCFWPPSTRLKWSRPDGTEYFPRLVGGNTCFDFSDVKEIQGSADEVRPSQFSLSQNYPNPFNPTTNFQFTLAKPAHVKIEIFNIVGQKVRTLVDKDMKPGVYTADWDGKDENGDLVSSSIYFYKMQAGEFSNMKKMVLLK
jgi:hypothetical protein